MGNRFLGERPPGNGKPSMVIGNNSRTQHHGLPIKEGSEETGDRVHEIAANVLDVVK